MMLELDLYISGPGGWNSFPDSLWLLLPVSLGGVGWVAQAVPGLSCFYSRRRPLAGPGRWRLFGPAPALSLLQDGGQLGGLAQGWAPC